MIPLNAYTLLPLNYFCVVRD